MAVYTKVEIEKLNIFLKGYDCGTALSFKGIAEGVENTNYLVETTKAKYILTLYEKRVKTDQLPFFLELKEFLAGKGLKVPLPIKNKKGQALGDLAGRKACLISFLDGVSLHKPNRQHLRNLGYGLANMHVIAQEFPQSRANDFGLDTWHTLFEQIKTDLDSISRGLRTIVEQELTFLDKSWPQDLPSGIIHADLFPDNVFFIGDELSGFIDFYFACHDALAYDLAICLNAWCFEPNHSFNITKSRSLIRAYDQTRALTPQEKQMFPTLARGGALRFLLTRCYDWLNTPVDALVQRKDPLDYLKKLEFHQTAHSFSAYGLDEESTS